MHVWDLVDSLEKSPTDEAYLKFLSFTQAFKSA